MRLSINGIVPKLFLACTVLVCTAVGAIQADAAEKILFQFSWLPGGDRAAYYLASKEGLFAAEGLEVELLSGKGSFDTITKIATGVVDMGEAGLDALLTAKSSNNVPVMAVMPVYTKMPDGLVTTTSSGIMTLKDVAGRKVGTPTFTSTNGLWPLLLQMNGVDPASVKLVKVDPNALAPLLATGQVDAIINYVTTVPQIAGLLKDANKTLHLIPLADYGLEGYSTSILVSQKMLSTRRDVVIKFTRALKKAERIMQDDPERAAVAVNAMVPALDLGTTAMVTRSTLPVIFNENTSRDGLGTFSPTLVKRTWEWIAKQQNLPIEKIDPMASIDLTITN